MLRTSILTSIVALFVFFVVAPASAQQNSPPPQQQEVPDIEVDDQELRQVAEAYIGVQDITAEFREAVNQVDNAEEAKAIQAEYAERANSAVEDEGLTVERYDTVVRVATLDEQLRSRLMAEIEGLLDTQ